MNVALRGPGPPDHPFITTSRFRGRFPSRIRVFLKIVSFPHLRENAVCPFPNRQEAHLAPPTRKEYSTVIRALRAGHARAADRLVPHLYDELHKVAAAYLRRERRDHTLQPTALVNEVYLRLVEQEGMEWEDRAHFLGWAAKFMRQVLVDHAQKRRAQKRGGEAQRVPLENLLVGFEKRALDLVALEEALERLTAIDERKSRIVELRFFGGLTIPETAEVLEVSHATVEREWRFARAWLHEQIAGGDGDDG